MAASENGGNETAEVDLKVICLTGDLDSLKFCGGFFGEIGKHTAELGNGWEW
jgi:hypothetical protein